MFSDISEEPNYMQYFHKYSQYILMLYKNGKVNDIGQMINFRFP